MTHEHPARQTQTSAPAPGPTAHDHAADAERHDTSQIDRVWTQNGAPAAAGGAATGGAAAAPASDSVRTDWWVDYETVPGKSKSIPDRYGDDQMIVSQLKVRPQGASSTVLRGGNMAKSGDVLLGTAMVPKGAGNVTATVQYAKKKQFDVALSLDGKLTRAERAALAQAKKDATAYVMARIEDRGDYDALGSEAQAQLQARFSGKTLTVKVNPVAHGKASQEYTADGADYSVSADSQFAVLVEPGETIDHATSWSEGESAEDGRARSEEGSLSTSQKTTTSQQTSIVSDIATTFTQSFESNFQNIIKSLDEDLRSVTTQADQTHEKEVKWDLGIAPPKDGKTPDSKSRDEDGGAGGTLRTIARKVWDGAKWLFKTGKRTVMMLPIVGTGIELLGDLWGTLTGRGSVKRSSVETDGSSKTNTTTTSQSHVNSHDSVVEVMSAMASTVSTEIRTSIQQESSASLGTDASSGTKRDESSKSSITKTSSGTTVTHEVGQPHIKLRKLG